MNATPIKSKPNKERLRCFYYPFNDGTPYTEPFRRYRDKFVKHERLVDVEYQTNKNYRSAFYALDQTKVYSLQKDFKKDAWGRVVLLRIDTVMIKDVADGFTYTPLYYKGKHIVLECIERPTDRVIKKPEQLIVITDQLKANEERKNIKWEYIPGLRGKLPDFKGSFISGDDLENQ